MDAGTMPSVAIVGTGLIGMGWSIVFARSGCDVRLYDDRPEAAEEARSVAAARLSDMVDAGLIEAVAPILARVRVTADIADALDGATYVQESVFEQVDVKRAVHTEIDRYLGATAIVGSSSSGIPASAYTEHVACRARCLVVHPVNPPYLIPVVELVPAPWTGADTVATARSLMADVGQAPVVLTREIEGFVLNRLQGALLTEAWKLYEEGVASLKDIDLTVAAGLGRRWSFMGPFETIDLNAPGGISDYAHRLGPLYARVARSWQSHEPWTNSLIERVEAERRFELPLADLKGRSRWRDLMLMKLMKHRG